MWYVRCEEVFDADSEMRRPLPVSILPDNPKNFNVDCVRVAKILVRKRESVLTLWITVDCTFVLFLLNQGSGILSSSMMKGLVFKREVEGG